MNYNTLRFTVTIIREITYSTLQSFSCLLNSLRLTASQLRLNLSDITLLLRKLLSVLSLSLMLRPTVSRPVCLGIKHPPGAYDQIFITLRREDGSVVYNTLTGLLMWGALSDEMTGLQLVLASAVILGSESRGTHDHILLSQIRDFPFRRLLRLAGLRWRYSTPPPHGISLF
jgi:hypothetical protein